MIKMNILPKLSEKIFNSGNGNKQNIKDMFRGISEKCDIEKPYMDRVLGKPVKSGNKTIYPVIEIVAIGNKMQNFKGVEIFPIALVVEEPPEKYVISLTGEEIDSDEFIGMIPGENEK